MKYPVGSRELARIIGCDQRTVNRWAARLQVGRFISDSRVFTRSEAQQIKAHVRKSSGNPLLTKPGQ